MYIRSASVEERKKNNDIKESWYVETKNNYVYTTNGQTYIKIGRPNKEYALRIAQLEAKRRNTNKDVNNIEFPEKDILKMTRHFSKKLIFVFAKRYKIKLDLEETENIALYVYCKCQQKFVPGEVLFTSYFFKSIYRKIYDNYFLKNNVRKKNNNYRMVTISDELIEKSKHSTLKQSQIEENKICINLNILPDHHRKIIIEHFFNQRCFQSIADDMGITRQRVHQITKKCLEILKNQIENN